MNRQPLQSMTFWGGLAYLVLDFAEKQGVIPGGSGGALVALIQNVAGLAALWGLRRAIPAP